MSTTSLDNPKMNHCESIPNDSLDIDVCFFRHLIGHAPRPLPEQLSWRSAGRSQRLREGSTGSSLLVELAMVRAKCLFGYQWMNV